jgi:hypothetical protein
MFYLVVKNLSFTVEMCQSPSGAAHPKWRSSGEKATSPVVSLEPYEIDRTLRSGVMQTFPRLHFPLNQYRQRQDFRSLFAICALELCSVNEQKKCCSE